MENWKSIDGYDGLYEISDMGNVRSLNYNKTGQVQVLSQAKMHNGYLRVVLCKGGHKKNFLVHRLVAEAFIPNSQNLPEVNHGDEVKSNNAVGNLEWCTAKHNCNHGTRNRRVANKLSKPIQQISLTTREVIATYKSVSEAERRTGISQGNISEVCYRKRRSAGGYIWKFVSKL